MSERTQRINTADFPSVREVHATEAELIDLSLGNLESEEESSVREHLNTCAACRERYSQIHADDGLGATKVKDPMVGAMLGEYRVEAALARGGMGVVYRGLQPMIGKHVAIKVLIPELDDDGSINRLLDEARAVNAIRHPNIIDIFSFGSLPDGRHYFVMELLDGKSLEDLINERRKLTADEVMTVLEQSCSALGAAHMAGVVHRDLKPANLFLSVLADQSWHVTVLDFGLAKRLGNTRKTATNIVMGTPGFMAPEQIRGKLVTAATDLYALGCVAWVLLTGSEPFQAEGIMDLLRAHIDEPLPSLAARAPQTPPALVALIERMLAKRPEDRPASALDVRNEVQRIRSGGGRQAAPLVRSPARKPGLVPAGMPSSALADAMAGTHVKHAETKARVEAPVANRQTEIIKRLEAPTPEGVPQFESGELPVPAAPSRLPWVAAAVVALLAVGGGVWVARSQESVELPIPQSASVDAGSAPSEVVNPPPALVEQTVDAGQAQTTDEVDAGLGAMPMLPTTAVDAGVSKATVKKVDPPVDRKKRLAGRLQQLEKRFTQAVAKGASLDLELAEVRGLRQGLDKRGDERSLDAIETAVQRLERIKP